MNPCVLFSGIPHTIFRNTTQPHIPYACGMDSACIRNRFRSHTECIPQAYGILPEYQNQEACLQATSSDVG